MIKHPRYGSKSEPGSSYCTGCVSDCQGTSYVYVTSSASSSWKQGGSTVLDKSSLLGVQTAGIYDGSISNYVFYNDQLPNGSYSETFGHSKGFFAYDSSTAFFVQHSIPKFPNYVASGYQYGSGQTYYGQHAFCMTLTPSRLDEVAKVMRYAYPWVYDSAIADSSLSNVAAVVKGSSLSGQIKTTVSAGWATLTLLGKASAADEDMLDSLAAPDLEQSLLSQSWLNSGGPIGSYCPATGYNVTDILSVTLPPSDTHATYCDHSKWAVSKASASEWWCALDNNHVGSQETRSGLAVCLQQASVSSLLRSAASTVGSCGDRPPGGACCYYGDTSCGAGQTCCSGSGKSYASESSCEQYGEKHGCVWSESTCYIPKVSAARLPSSEW